MFKHFAIAAILVILSTITLTAHPSGNPISASDATGRPEKLLPSPETVKALERLGDLSPSAIRACLKMIRRPTNRPSQETINKLVEAQHLSIRSGRRVDQLKAALQPVLEYHGRGQAPIYILRSEQPKAYMVARAVIIITTRLMISASDEEIRGVVAHELAHEYVWEERSRGLEAKNGKLMRECELFCDAVAAFTLKEIGDDPASYGRILERLTLIGMSEGSAMRKESYTHPSLDARKKLNQFLCRQFTISFGTTPIALSVSPSAR
jgi:hypothetical protein